MEKPAPKLIEKVREVLHLKHDSPKTEESYVHGIRQFVRYYHLRHPHALGAQGDPSSSFDYTQEPCEGSRRTPTLLCFGDCASAQTGQAALSKSLS